MKKLILASSLLLVGWQPLLADDLKLEGEGVINYKYPENFQETKRYIRKGVVTNGGDCEFTNTMHLKPGQRVFTKELAYNPHACESLMIEGNYTVESKKKTGQVNTH